MAAAFVVSAREIGLSQVLFVRHANTEPMRTGAAKRKDQPH